MPNDHCRLQCGVSRVVTLQHRVENRYRCVQALVGREIVAVETQHATFLYRRFARRYKCCVQKAKAYFLTCMSNILIHFEVFLSLKNFLRAKRHLMCLGFVAIYELSKVNITT